MLRLHRSLSCGLAVGVAVLVSAAPAQAAVLSKADATALSGQVAGQGTGTGPVTASYDGGQEQVSGNPTPGIPTGGLLDLGVLTQQAVAGNGFARACAGVAGNGGGIVQLGEGSCLTPGDAIDASLTDLSLESLLGQVEAPEGLPLPAELPIGELTGLTKQIDGAIAQATAPLEDQLGALGLQLRVDVVEGRCVVEGGSPSGSASIANASLVATGGDQTITLLELPANPEPNDKVVTDLSKVLDVLLGGVETQLEKGLDGALAPLGEAVVEPLRAAIVDGVRENLEEQLAPLEDNLLKITLNEQTRTPDSIRVTALHAEVLPIAQQQLGASLVDLRIGEVGCGPAGRVAGESVEEPEPEAAAPARPAAQLPTRVSAGVGTPQGSGDASGGGIGALPLATLALGTAAAGVAGIGALRRRLQDG